MNQLELLNVLDVIKNEDVYNKRLTELKEAEQKLKDTRYIKETMESVDRLRNEAADALEKLKLKSQTEEKRLKDWEQKEKERIEALEIKIKAEREKATIDLAEAKQHVLSVRDLKKELDVQQAKLGERMKMLSQQERNLVNRENILKQRIQRINEIMKEPNG